MENRERVKCTITEMLQNYGIMDKDKLETLPEALTSYFGHILVDALMDLNAELTKNDVEKFMRRTFYGTTQT